MTAKNINTVKNIDLAAKNVDLVAKSIDIAAKNIYIYIVAKNIK